MGSADLMRRNLDHRVEVVFPIESAEHVRHVRDKMLTTYLKDNTRARVMQKDGTYVRPKLLGEDKAVDVQEFFMNNYKGKHPEELHLYPIHSGIVK